MVWCTYARSTLDINPRNLLPSRCIPCLISSTQILISDINHLDIECPHFKWPWIFKIWVSNVDKWIRRSKPLFLDGSYLWVKLVIGRHTSWRSWVLPSVCPTLRGRRKSAWRKRRRRRRRGRRSRRSRQRKRNVNNSQKYTKLSTF